MLYNVGTKYKGEVIEIMSNKENVKKKSVNSIKKVIKEMMGNDFKETEIIESIVEAMFVGMVELFLKMKGGSIC